MAVINDKYRFMFLCEPHTASRSIRDILMTLETSRETSTYHHCDVPRALSNHFLTARQASEYYYFATIRDPYDLLTTQWYISSPRRDQLFKWIRGYTKNMRHATLFWRFLFNKEPLYNVKTFIRFEKLEEGLNQVLDQLGAPAVQLPERKDEYKTPGKTEWQHEWSGRLIDWAAEHYPDINRYGYGEGYSLDDLDATIPL